ncbi:MAG TPA: hypothetical protein VFR58_08145 [Flavisolibacter sp.]|nr:hypothetical protein [Flavisolibacter sp.]
MKLREFKYLEKQRKIDLLSQSGVYLCTRQEPEFTIDLYQMDSFYIEAYYYHGCEGPGYMRAFSSTDFLEPYLNKINLTNLLAS